MKRISLALALALSACVTEVEPPPELSGVWHGRVEAPEPARLTLYVDEADGLVTGWGTLQWWSDVAYRMDLTGSLAASDVTIRVSHPLAVTWDLELHFDGPDALVGHAGGWPVRLERIDVLVDAVVAQP